jgi:hypothetical protein
LAIQVTVTEKSRIFLGNLSLYFGQHANYPYRLNLAISNNQFLQIKHNFGPFFVLKKNPFYELLAGQNNCCQVGKKKGFLATKEKH